MTMGRGFIVPEEVQGLDHTGASDIIFSGTRDFQAANRNNIGAKPAGNPCYPGLAGWSRWYAVRNFIAYCKPHCGRA